MGIFDWLKKKENKKIISAKVFYCILIAYFLVFGILLINDKHYIFGGIFILLPIIATVIIWKKYPRLFNKILLFISKKVINPKTEKYSKRIAFQKVVYIFIFLMIPLFVCGLLISGQYHYSTAYGSSGGSFGSEEGVHQELNCNSMEINPSISQDYRAKLSYFLGSTLNIPVFDICFVNNGTKYAEDTLNPSFISNITINDTSFTVPYKGSSCIAIPLNKQKIDYCWSTQYIYSIKNRTIDLSTEPNNFITFNINDNFIFMGVLVILSWMAIMHLLYRVWKDFIELG